MNTLLPVIIAVVGAAAWWAYRSDNTDLTDVGVEDYTC